MRLSIILISSIFLLNSCQSFSSLNGDNQTGLYPSKNITIEYQQEWQINLYQNRITDFKKRPIGFKKIVFLGNSITEGAKSWNKRFNLRNLVNRGISGDITEGVLARLDEIYYYKPLAVFLLIGINDIFDSNIENRERITPKYVANNILRIAENIQKNSKYTKVYIQTVLPVDLIKYKEIKGNMPSHSIDLNKQIIEINSILKLAQTNSNIKIIDLYEIFVDQNGFINNEFSSDGIHLNETGYKIWIERLEPELFELNKVYLN